MYTIHHPIIQGLIHKTIINNIIYIDLHHRAQGRLSQRMLTVTMDNPWCDMMVRYTMHIIYDLKDCQWLTLSEAFVEIYEVMRMTPVESYIDASLLEEMHLHVR